ncbi:MAG: response regulator [Anaerolineales bacterium]|nr:response regulator [Anaerolineales bacterium]
MNSAVVYIVDEHEPVRGALAERLGRAQGIAILGHSGEVERVIEAATNDHPDVVLLEIKRTDGMGIELLRQLAHLPDPPQVIVLTSYPTEWEKDAAHRAGAAAYLLKDIDSDELIRYIADIVG